MVDSSDIIHLLCHNCLRPMWIKEETTVKVCIVCDPKWYGPRGQAMMPGERFSNAPKEESAPTEGEGSRKVPESD